MAKLKGPLFSENASGSVTPVLTFSLRNSGQQVRYQRKQKDKITAGRVPVRENYSVAVSAWNFMSYDEKSVWDSSASGMHMTGYNLFMKSFVGLDILAIYASYGARIYGIFLYGFE